MSKHDHAHHDHTGVVLLLIGGLGIASSPIVNGHPVLLSPERLALKTYLDAATGWQQRFTEIDQQLSLIDLPPAVSSASTLTTTVITASPIMTSAPLVITVPPAGGRPRGPRRRSTTDRSAARAKGAAHAGACHAAIFCELVDRRAGRYRRADAR
jgi:hypothetical protein